MIDVAADDDHGADLGRGAPEAGEAGREQAEAAVPEQRRHCAQRPHAQRAQLLVVLLRRSSMVCRPSAAMIGVTSTVWAMIMAVGE